MRTLRTNILFLGLVCMIIGVEVYAQDGKIVCVPRAMTVHEGQVFELLVNVFPGSEPVSVVDYMLKFDPEFLTVLSVERAQDSPLNLNTIETNIDHDEGTILYSAFSLNKPWPDTLFSLIRIQFMAIAETDQTRLSHIVEGHPKTILAYAGKNTLHSAPDAEVHILPAYSGLKDASVTYSDKLNVDCSTNHEHCSVQFSVSDNSHTVLSFSNENQGLSEVIFSNKAQVGTTYLFEIDTSVMNQGQYLVELNSSGISRKHKLNIE